MSLYCAGIRFQEYGTSGAIEAPYNGWRPYNGCSGLPGRACRAEKGESMGIEEMLKTEGGVRRAPGMSRKEFLRLGGAGMAGAALLSTAGCGVFESGGSGGGGGGSTKSVAFNLEDAVRDLDSATTTDSVSTDILLNVMSGLYRLDVNTRPVPDMAESVDISEDQLTYTFKITRRRQVVQRRPCNRQRLRVRLEAGPQSRHRRPVRLHHHHLRQGRRRV